MAISFNNLRQFSSNDGTVSQSANAFYVLASGPTFTGRSLTAAADLFTDTAVTGDYMLWKRSYGASKPKGIQIDVSTAIVSATGHSITWEYRKADGTWAAFTGVVDNTTNFTVVGQNTVTWDMPTDWGTNATSINSISGAMWFRARLTVNSTLSEGGRTTLALNFYDYSVRVDANHQYDSGTATSGTLSSGTATMTDTSKAWTTNILRNRYLYVHTGTGAGTKLVIKSNTATVVTFIDTPFSSDARLEIALDNTSQYVICANFEDLYQADISGGWGVITRAGAHSYAFNCFLNFDAGAFGEVSTNVEFTNDFYFYCTGASTNRYPQIFGFRLPLFYGAEKAIMGNTIISNRTTPMDNRGLGFSISTEYTFSGGNKYLLRADYPLTGTDGFIRSWFNNYHKESISDIYEGWRSVVWPKTTTPRTEVRNLTVQDGSSGIEVPSAAFKGVRSFYNASLGVYYTGSTVATADDFTLTLSNPANGSRFFSPLQFFGLTSASTLTDYKGTRFRPMTDVYGSTGNTGSVSVRYSLRALITDEQGNLLQNAKVQVSDSLAQNRKTYLSYDGVDDTVTVPNNAASNQLFGATSFSVEAWVWGRTTGGGTLGRVLDKNGNSGYYLLNGAGSWSFNLATNTGIKTSNSVTAILGSWNHLVGVWNGSTIQLYVNNTTGTAGAATGTAVDESAVSLVLGNNITGIRGHDGLIRRIRLYRNKALSSTEVATLWDSGNYTQNQASPVTGCTAEYNFTEGTGTTLADTSGNGATATLGATTTAPTWVDTNAGETSNAVDVSTGTEGSYLPATVLSSGSRYSLTNQPTSPTRLRVKLLDYRDSSASTGTSARIEISGTDVNDFVITEVVFFEEFRNGTFLTTQEFKTVAASGVFFQGMSTSTVTIDNVGVIPPQTIKTEAWRTSDDVTLKLTDFNPIRIKVSRPGFEPTTIVRNIFESQDIVVSLKRSVLDLT